MENALHIVADAPHDATAKLLIRVLSDFKINAVVREISIGPVVSTYEIETAPGVRCAKVISLAEDIARNMAVQAVRIAPVRASNLIGIEVPNTVREVVSFTELLNSVEWQDTHAVLPLALGKDINGVPVIMDLTKAPHILMAGTTGSGKSVGIHGIILSLLSRFSPDEVKLILVDPKQLELSAYAGIPHLITPVITDAAKAVAALRWVLAEMERRYTEMAKLSVRNIAAYNELMTATREAGDEITQSVIIGFDSSNAPIYDDEIIPLDNLPFIVVVIDEVADLMLVASKDLEVILQRLAQMSRAAGIHLILSTQRPSVNVITGTIKANFPTRISFQVGSKIDSRTILGQSGAEQLLGNGDMMLMQGASITRIQGAYCSEQDVSDVVELAQGYGTAVHIDDVTSAVAV